MTEALRQGMGQVGSAGQSYVTFDDLVQGGLLSETGSVQNYSSLYTDGSVAGGAYQGTGTGSKTYDLTPPEAVTDVVLSSLVGAVQIEWTPPAPPLSSVSLSQNLEIQSYCLVLTAWPP